MYREVQNGSGFSFTDEREDRIGILTIVHNIKPNQGPCQQQSSQDAFGKR